MGAEKHDTLRIATPVEGLNRFEHEVALTERPQCVDALNCYEDKGVIRRRPGYQSVYLPAGHELPAGACSLFHHIAGTLTHAPTRAGVLFSGGEAGDFVIVGSETPFDSIFWRHVSAAAALDRGMELAVHYSTGVYSVDLTATASWRPIPWYIDTTRRGIDGESFLGPLRNSGRIAFHRSQTPLWATMSLTPTNGVARALYCIALSAVEINGDAAVQPQITLEAKGVTVALHEPVNTIVSRQLRDTRVRLYATDRKKPRSVIEQGAMLSTQIKGRKDARELGVAVDEFSGLYHTFSTPSFRNGAINVPIASSTDLATGSVAYGTADKFHKGSRWYSWRKDEHEQGREKTNAAAAANSADTNDIVIADAVFGLQGLGSTALEHVRMLGTAGFATLHEIYAAVTGSPNNSYFFHPDVAGPISAADTVNLDRPPRHLRMIGEEDRLIEILENDEQTIEPVDRAFADVPPGGFTAYQGTQIHAEVIDLLRWRLVGRQHWTHALAPHGKSILMTNGGPLMEYDGHRLREFLPDTTSIAAQVFANIVPTEKSGKREILTAESTLWSKLPDAKYVAVYNNRVFIVPRGEPNTIIFSEGQGAFKIWHRLNYVLIMDDGMQPITGLTTWSNYLVIHTAGSIHLGRIVPVSDRAILDVRIASKAFGWMTSRAVAQIDLLGFEALEGVSVDGITAFSGGEPRQIVDRWDRLIEGGVNRRRLFNACSAVWRSRRLAFHAVPSKTSEVNDRIIVHDYQDGSFWVWSHPDGVSSLTVERDTAGHERLLIGTVDGFVQSLAEQDLDDGAAVNGHFISAPTAPYPNRETHVHGVKITGDVSGNQSLAVDLFMNRSKVRSGSQASSPIYGNPDDQDDQDPYYGTWVLDNAAGNLAAATQLGHRRFSSQRFRFDAGQSRGELVQVKISGAHLWSVRDIYLIARMGSVRGG